MEGWAWWVGYGGRHWALPCSTSGRSSSTPADSRPGTGNTALPSGAVNALLLVACVSVGISGMPGAGMVVGGVRLRSAVPASLSVPGWLAPVALLFSNAVFHLVGTYQTKRLSPGVRTGLLLYVPLALVGYWHFIRAGQVSVIAAAVSASLGGSYHLWASLAHRWRSRSHMA